MAKRNLEEKRKVREAREVRKAAAAVARHEFRLATNSCECGTVLVPHVITLLDGDQAGKQVTIDLCPRCFERERV